MQLNVEKAISSATEVWQAALQNLRAKSESLYRQWFSRMTPLTWQRNKLRIGVPDDFFRDMVIENYSDLLTDALRAVRGQECRFELVDGYPAPDYQPEEPEKKKPESSVLLLASPQPQETSAAAAQIPSPRRNIHDYSFCNFVVGHSNRHAFAAAKAVAEAPGTNYNPLFIYGTNGVGKTHLLQAISGEIRRTRPSMTVRCVTCDEILNDFYELLVQRKGFSAFRASLQDVDVLLIDDIHRLAKKTAMQEEFFNIFNLLTRQNKQIVLTSDRQPCEIQDLDKRLSSRFEQGMSCEVGMLEYEERLVTLRMWRDSTLTKPPLPDRFLEFLAGNISSNVRRLKGCFLRLSAYLEMSGSDDMTIEDAEELLHAQIAEESAARDIRPEMIQQMVANHFGVTVADIIGLRRTRQVAEPRMVAMYLCRELTRLSSNEIGDAFGRTHANVLHAAKTISARCQADRDFQRSIAQLTRQLQKH